MNHERTRIKSVLSRRELFGEGAKAIFATTLFSKSLDQMAESKETKTMNRSKSMNDSEIVSKPKNVIKPKPLKPGDRVALLCPSGRPHNPSAVNKACAIVEEMGFKPVTGKNALKIYGTMAGTDEERLSDFHAAVTDDSIAAIICITGGYGAIHLVDKFDWKLLEKNPKFLVGSDDNTHLLLAAYAKTNLVSLHAPNADRLNSKESFESLKLALTSKEPLPSVRANYRNVETAADFPSERKARTNENKWQVNYFYSAVSGISEGKLVGGNLTALGTLMGTPYQPQLRDSVLFLEDINEDHGVLDRWFTNLYLSGALGQVSGVAVGDFENCHTKECFNMYSLEDLFGDRMKQQNKPCCFGLPFGQSARSLTAPIGVTVRLDATKGELSYLEPASS